MAEWFNVAALLIMFREALEAGTSLFLDFNAIHHFAVCMFLTCATHTPLTRSLFSPPPCSHHHCGPLAAHQTTQNA